ncbi:alpha/beta-hydrolase [Hypomontagnella monticulosa]|nr:alpha/beta-hydrolase [Hypomontagnella monticulosa]
MGFFGLSKKKHTPEGQPAPPAPVHSSASPVPCKGQVPPRRCRPPERPYQGPAPGQHVGFLLPPPPSAPPPGWNNTLALGPVSPPQYHEQRPYLPIVVNQHYYLGAPTSHQPPVNPYPNSNGMGASSRLKLSSAANIACELIPGNMVHQTLNDGLPRWHSYGTQLLNQGAAMYDQISSSLNDVMTLIDRDKYVGNETELFTFESNLPPSPSNESSQQVVVHRGPVKKSKKEAPKDTSKAQTKAIASSLASRGYFAKVELYANSKLPPNLPPLRLYIDTYPLICLAAQYSERVYDNPRGSERDTHVDADWRTGAKAMRIKSVPMDDMDTIVFAIRGTATFMDWSVNLNTAPTAPTGFLDDPSNFCHAGFLSVARKMIPPVAARLRNLLEEDPKRCSYSLLITGHSAGGAIASLLYSHMLSTSKDASSELNLLTGCFRRVHCITFGAPPVSLFPLQKPPKSDFKKFVFLTFINEGDPVARADKAYVKSLLELLLAPAPAPSSPELKESKGPNKHLPPSKGTASKHSKSHNNNSSVSLASKTSKVSAKSGRSSSHSSSRSSKSSKPRGPIWKAPPSSLSNAGQIIILRSENSNPAIKRAKTVEERLNEGVVAQVATDGQLRGLIWGDPVSHVMKLYTGRVETLAMDAVTMRKH